MADLQGQRATGSCQARKREDFTRQTQLRDLNYCFGPRCPVSRLLKTIFTSHEADAAWQESSYFRMLEQAEFACSLCRQGREMSDGQQKIPPVLFSTACLGHMLQLMTDSTRPVVSRREEGKV